MRTDQSRLRRPGVVAAAAAVVIAGIIGGVGVAGARENHTIFSVENGGTNQCFSTSDKALCATGERADLTVRTGDTVTWDFKNANGMYHNAAPLAANASTPPNQAWNTRSRTYIQAGGKIEWTFGDAGVYHFECTLHPSMKGTITVEGGSVETPEPTPTEEPTEEPTETPTEEPTPEPTFQSTPPPGATATPDNHLNTPAPGKAAKADKTAPRVEQTRARPAAQGAKLSFWLSEPATLDVTVRRKGVSRPVTAATLHVAAGARSVLLRSSSLRKRGTYTVEWRAVDAMANKSVAAKTTLQVKG